MSKSKIWKVNINSPAQISITDESAYMIGAENRFIKVNDNGTTIYGPMSVVAGAESIKTGGMFTQLPNLVQMIPSTMVSPIPAQIPMPPLNVAFDLAEDVSYFAMMLALSSTIGE